MEVDAKKEARPAPIAWDADAHPWRRYGARFLDVQLIGGGALILLGLLVGVAASEPVYAWFIDEARWKRLFIFGPLSWIVSAFAIAGLLSWKGTTPGKLLFGIRVRPVVGGKFTIARAMKREALLLVWGIGFALPLLNLIAAITSFSRVESGVQAKWDEQTGHIVEARTPSGWQLIGIIIATALVIGGIIWSAIERFAALAQ